MKLQSGIKSSSSTLPLSAAPAGGQIEPEYADEHVTGRLLDVPVKTLQNWRVDGRGPPFCKFGALVRYHLKTVRAWAAERQRASTSEAA